MRALGWDYPKEVLRDADPRKTISEAAIRIEKQLGLTTGLGEDFLQVILTIAVAGWLPLLKVATYDTGCLPRTVQYRNDRHEERKRVWRP